MRFVRPVVSSICIATLASVSAACGFTPPDSVALDERDTSNSADIATTDDPTATKSSTTAEKPDAKPKTEVDDLPETVVLVPLKDEPTDLCDNGDYTPEFEDDSPGEAVEEGDEDKGTPAKGIRIKQVQANQGVGIPLFMDGSLIAVEERNSPIIGCRRMLMRALWETDADFKARDIEARLTLIEPDGRRRMMRAVRKIDGAPDWSTLDGTFSWVIPPYNVQDGTTFSVGFFEVEGAEKDKKAGVDATETTPRADGPSRVPESGFADFGAWGEPMELKVRILPIATPCVPEGPTVTEEVLDQFQRYYYNNYPVQRVYLEFAELYTHTYCPEPCDTSFTYAQREAEAPAPNVYYQGMYGQNDLFGGCSFGWTAEKDEDRSTHFNNFHNNGFSSDLGAHELGHNMGSPHPWDEDYPYETVDLHYWGWGVIDGEHNYREPPGMNAPVDPTYWSDFMGYTYPYWSQDLQYNRHAERIRILTSWDYEDAGSDAKEGTFEPVHRVQVSIRPDGITWMSAKGRPMAIPRAASAEQNVRYFKGDELVAQGPISVRQASEHGVMRIKMNASDEIRSRSDRFEISYDGQVQHGTWQAIEQDRKAFDAHVEANPRGLPEWAKPKGQRSN